MNVTERRSRELRLTIEVPEAERVIRKQPYSSVGREYEVREVHFVSGVSNGDEYTSLTFYGPLVTKAGRSDKVRVDERFWRSDEGLSACPPSVTAVIRSRVAAWQSEAAS